ncbi:MAG: aspartate carbamoyltransferase [Candidatus Kerfeldbacteria bacterium]|nr:aspartate carbamoyltransferase [Candidatus Kerfeldbacteria bacterium]
MNTNTMRHLISITDLTTNDINAIFQRTDQILHDGFQPTLAHTVIATLFFEPSTRTRLSFETGILRSGGRVISVTDPAATSTTKGETLEDTVRVISSYVDAIVLRYPEAGAASRAAIVSTVPVINAGDGTGEHPTQSLYDLYTIRQALGRTDHFHIVCLGNLKYYRATRSLVRLLARYPNVTMTFVSAPELAMKTDILDELTQQGINYQVTTNLTSVLPTADVVYQTRMQKEWLSDTEYQRLKDQYIITPSVAAQMKPGAIIMHALPRVNEISPTVDSLPQAYYFKQAALGMPVRAALLQYWLQT